LADCTGFESLTLFLDCIRIKVDSQDNYPIFDLQVKMSENIELIVGICALILVITLTRRFHAWRFKRAYIFIIDDLKKKSAYSAHSAVELPYAQRNPLQIGLRQHRPQALEHLILENIVAKTEDGRYYLKDKTV
jgi:hypothetical protein